MKRWCLCVLVCLMICSMGAAQGASKWGMSGEMHEFLRRAGVYNDYTDIRSGYDRTAPCFPFVASNGEHNVLVVVRRTDEGQLQQVGRYPRAVLQPGAGRAAECWLGDNGNGVQLKSMWSSTGDYVRLGWDDDDTVRAEEDLLLREAKIGKMTFLLQEDKCAYTVSDGNDSAQWLTAGIRVSEFCWDMMPESVNEVLQLNFIYEMIGESGMFDGRYTADLQKSKRLAVYAAPGENAWRGAMGRAEVSLKEPFDVLGEDNGWWLVEYEISLTQRRVGYVHPAENSGEDVLPLQWKGCWVELCCDAEVTDDPHGIGEILVTLQKGQSVWCYGSVNAFWAYVETEAEGKAARGFIPLASIASGDRVIE